MATVSTPGAYQTSLCGPQSLPDSSGIESGSLPSGNVPWRGSSSGAAVSSVDVWADGVSEPPALLSSSSLPHAASSEGQGGGQDEQSLHGRRA